MDFLARVIELEKIYKKALMNGSSETNLLRLDFIYSTYWLNVRLYNHGKSTQDKYCYIANSHVYVPKSKS